jgi:hypothetical protein
MVEPEALAQLGHGALDPGALAAVDHAEQVVGPFRCVAPALVAQRHFRLGGEQAADALDLASGRSQTTMALAV